MSSADDQKRLSGEAAAELVENGMVVGLGTGSTAAWFVKALAARGLSDIRGVPTSEATANMARELGLPLAALDDVKTIDLTVDGADEIGPGLSLIKGGGAALLREKLVWEASTRCVVIADAAKKVDVLGKFPLPIEVVRFGHVHTGRRLADIAAEFDLPPPRLRQADRGMVVTDGGNLIYDMASGRIDEPAALATALKSVTGVVDHGLFLDLADEALVGTDQGVIHLRP
ncbi:MULTISPECIES: ribose-5-phosphate isomerase RpiA [Caulobacter]|jgi:ribose 5-phosphate isomerase A|uniref:Ribose-5-phosphate isomerase A n=1 Tax=Caulobacter vibrioides OR37 TaxID=1292034 RepID=R0D1K1_CAUVI|nr:MULTISPECIES: ribose-5-phosphate isomerase RpiA [Caulobacter]ENZ82526.1 ribose-5-phosphate isomerase [Caulobacter vibrioides OR37]MBQ1561340.1 ribose-5-phosphate isomerase RpiA [Caulobacter sp.]